MLSGKRLHKIALEFGLDISSDYGEHGGLEPYEMSYDERLHSSRLIAECSGESLESVLWRGKLDLRSGVLGRLERMEEQLIRQDYVTFTDMLRKFLSGEVKSPSFDLLIVDEAQDLNSIQWSVIEKLRASADTFVVAGDDCQAIHEWAGADIGYFLSLPRRHSMSVEHLTLSHRCSSEVRKAALKVSGLISRKFTNRWRSVNEGGSLEYRTRVSDLRSLLRGSSLGKSVYLLARTNYYLNVYRKWCYSEGIIWVERHQRKHDLRTSLDTKLIRSILLYCSLQSGAVLEHDYARVAEMCSLFRVPISPGEYTEYSLSSLKTDGAVCLNWRQMFTVDARTRQYLVLVFERYRGLYDHAIDLLDVARHRFQISTIHGVKGGEADIVVIAEQLTRSIHDSWVQRRDSELRVLYTGITRARDRVVFLGGSGSRRYNTWGWL